VPYVCAKVKPENASKAARACIIEEVDFAYANLRQFSFGHALDILPPIKPFAPFKGGM